MALRSIANRMLDAWASTDHGIRSLKPWQHGTLNVWITHYYGENRPHLYNVGQDFAVAHFCDRLKRAQRFFRFVTVRELLSEPYVPNSVALTFDDGLDLEREGVLNVLADLAIPATFYLIPPCLDNRELMWRHALSAIAVVAGEDRARRAYCAILGTDVCSAAEGAALAMAWGPRESKQLSRACWEHADMPLMSEYLAEHRPYFTTKHVQGLLSSGHEIGFHTVSHVDCGLLDEDGARNEIVIPGQEFRKRWNLDWMTFAYPYGRRLRTELEERVFASNALDVMLGTGGSAALGSPRHRLERLDVETDWDRAVYADPGSEIARKRLRR